MKIDKFDKPVCNTLRKEVEAALLPFANKYGLTLSMRGGTYNDWSWLAKVEFKVKETAEGKSAEQAEFEKYCHQFSCKPQDYGRTLTINGKEFTLIGFALNRSKFTIKVKSLDTGKIHLFVESVLRQIKERAA